MLGKFFAERKIRKFLSAMAKAMPQRYGDSPPYTEGQVLTTVKELGYPEDFNELALVVFCDPENYKNSGLSEELIKKYKGYRITHSLAPGGSDGGFGGGDGGGGGD